MRSGVFSVAVLAGGIAACSGAASAKLSVPRGFSIEAIANVGEARELASLPDGDLLVGTFGRDVYLIPNAEGKPGEARLFATLPDDQAAGVTFDPKQSEIYVATTGHVWSIPYRGGRPAEPKRIADVRSAPPAPGTDGDIHTTTSLAFARGLLYVSAGSSCNATAEGGKPCVEIDPTRAAIWVMHPDGSDRRQRAKRVRNAIALAVNPQTGSVWIGDAGQDDLPFGHPYEFLDDLSAHSGVADYGWPLCEENHHAYWPGANCTNTIEPLIELPAYSTIIGAAFYPQHVSGAYAFPAAYRGGLFATAHGSWHRDRAGCFAQPPRVVFIPMNGDRPVKPVDWTNPATQWTDFVSGFQTGCRARIGRATGITVGAKGSLFIADDASGTIYRVRPTHSS